MGQRACVPARRENPTQFVTHQFIGVVTIDKKQWPARLSELPPDIERDLNAVTAMQMDLVETSHQTTMLLTRMFDVIGIRWQIDGVNFIAEVEHLATFMENTH